jgi:tRNA U38,U39,U40 pseudouridine synthase TruA
VHALRNVITAKLNMFEEKEKIITLINEKLPNDIRVMGISKK